MNILLLDNNEQFISFLNPELISLVETDEEKKLRSVKVTYWVEDFEQAKNDFKVGHKLWISGHQTIKDCLYVIDTDIERDYFKENNVTFEVEDAIVELNYVPPITQLDITEDNGFTFTNNDEEAFVLDRSALGYIFGDYFNIGIVQDVLHDKLKNIAIQGMMNCMELLRFIEEETSNVFITRYEKDINSNIIHKYLDFLNPNNTDKSWEVVIDYDFPIPEEDDSNFISPDNNESNVSEDLTDSENFVTFEKDDEQEVTLAENLQLRLVKDDDILRDEEENLLSWDAEDIGLTGSQEEYEITLNYSTVTINEELKEKLVISVLGESYDIDEDEYSSDEIVVTGGVGEEIYVDLPKSLELQLYDTLKDKIIFTYGINAVLGKVHDDILDLGYNTENITYEIDEKDTYKAIAPLINIEGFSKDELNTVLDRWEKLVVNKGDNIPMKVQKISLPSSSGNKETNSSVNNYWRKPIKQSNNNDKLDWWRGVTYWSAPFSKKADEMFVMNEEDTGVEYHSILQRHDIDKEPVSTPKIGNVETKEEDVYAIFYDVCMELKEKKYPELNIEVDVANYKNGQYNNYELYDKVYVKIPTFDKLIVATVNKTVKNAQDTGSNKIELSNFVINSKIVQLETEIIGETVSFKYPNKKNFTVKLVDIDENPLKNKFVTLALLKVENQSATHTGIVHNLKTNSRGEVTITMKYDPGNYQIECNFGGDTYYESSSLTVDVNVSGTKINYPTVKQGQKLVHKNIRWDKYGRSPKADFVVRNDTLLSNYKSSGNLIIAIGKANTTSDKRKYGTGLLETIFERKCRRCGSSDLVWGYRWNKKHDSGYFKPTKSVETGALTGRIICKKCGTSYNVLGVSGNKKLTVKKSTVKTTNTQLNQLKKGKLLFGVKYYTVSTRKPTGNNGKVIARNTDCSHTTGSVRSPVKKKAKLIVKSKTGISAVKAIAKWISKHIKNEDRKGLYQSPSKTLHRKKGNSFCKTDLLIHMCDAVGVQELGISCYYVYMHKDKKKSKKKVKRKTKNKTTKHMVARINGTYVDCTLKNPWGKYKTGFGAIKNADVTRYPCLPISKKYS